jgi:hypothetical protein
MPRREGAYVVDAVRVAGEGDGADARDEVVVVVDAGDEKLVMGSVAGLEDDVVSEERD